MLDLRLVYEGEGRFRARTKLDFDLCCQDLTQGQMVRAKLTAPRSVRQNALFHALVQAAHDNQRGGPKLATWEHLKAWLLIEVGHCDEVRFSIGRIPPAVAMLVAGGMAKVFRERWSYMGTSCDPGRNEIVLRFAKSVAFSSCDHETMTEIMDRVIPIICTQIVPGCDPAGILNMAQERAA